MVSSHPPPLVLLPFSSPVPCRGRANCRWLSEPSRLGYSCICQEKQRLFSEAILHTPLTARAGGQLWVATISFLTPASAIPQHHRLHPQGWQKHQPYIPVAPQPNDKHVNREKRWKAGHERLLFQCKCVSVSQCVCVCWRWRVPLPDHDLAHSLGNSQPWWGQQRGSRGEEREANNKKNGI